MRSVPFHYGWVILASGALGSFMTTPGQTYGVSPFFDPVAHDLGLSRGAVATAYTLGTLAGVLPAPFVGRWIDRRGPRVAGVLIGLALAVACVVMASSNSALSLTIGFAALRGAAIGALSLVSQHVINLWFVTRRGLAASAVSFALALGGMVFPLMSEILMRYVGWRSTYVVLGTVVLVTMTVVGGVLFRSRPEQFGLAPDLGRPAARRRTPTEPVFTRPEALRTVVFWTMSAANVASNGLGTGLLLNHYDLLGRNGVSRDLAVILFTPLALTQLGVVLLAGLLVDRFQPHRVLALPMCAMATACLLAQAGELGLWPFVYAGTLGIALGSFQAANVAAWAHYFGRAHLGEIRGLTFVITIVGAALGPLPFGWASERGGYGPVLLAGAVGCVVVAVVNLLAPSPRNTGGEAARNVFRGRVAKG
jgi:MFS family permease